MAANMDPSIGKYKVVRESVESFTRDVDLGGGVCTSDYQERVMWVECVIAVTVLKHRGALIDELGRYKVASESEGQGLEEAVTTARWASSAMRIDTESDLVVEVWRVSRVEPMVERGGVMVPAPSGMACGPDFVDSAWTSETNQGRDDSRLVWSSKWAEQQSDAAGLQAASWGGGVDGQVRAA